MSFATARLVAAHEAAVTYYHHLLRHAAAAEPARAYLSGEGWRPPRSTRFSFRLLSRWLAWSARPSAGAMRGRRRRAGHRRSAQQGEGVHDRFRGRVMFLIRDERGRAVGFGACLIGDGTPKYLNSPQSALFDKGSLLYALRPCPRRHSRRGRG
ncbi:MAG: hypothetical protein U0531_03105 [Dehalococcoidia bacterium]